MNREIQSIPKIIGDTNFWISATLGSGLCAKLKNLIILGKIRHFTSLALMGEFADVLRRHFGYSDDEAYDAYNDLWELSTLVYPEFGIRNQIQMARNHTDNSVLECAVFANVDSIVTRDKDLLVLHPFSGIHILTPEDFLEELLRLGVVDSRQLP